MLQKLLKPRASRSTDYEQRNGVWKLSQGIFGRRSKIKLQFKKSLTAGSTDAGGYLGRMADSSSWK